MAKTLYLHVGMPKCASTTIQGALRRHAQVFADHGKFYGHPQHDTTQGQGNVSVLLADIRANRKNRVRTAMRFFLERDTDVIMSSEMFIGLARNRLADDLIAQVREHGFTPKLICYVRRQDDWIESDYKQHIKGGSDWTDGIEALMARRIKTRVLDYHWLMENWARSLGREAITVVPLKRGQSEAYPLERFMQFLGLDPALAEGLVQERQNVSPPVGLVEPMRHLKQAYVAQGIKLPHIPKPLHRFLTEAPGRIEVPQRKFLLPYKRRATLLKRYAGSNAALSRDYLGGARAFDEGLAEDAASERDLGAEAAGVLAAWICSDPAQLAPPSPGQAAVARWRFWRRR